MYSKRLKYKSLPNIRDLGGMHTADGHIVVPGRLIRCGHLAELQENELARLSDLVDTVVDFRTEKECREKPDIEIKGITYYHLSVIASQAPGVSREEESDIEVVQKLLLKPEEAKDHICGLYRLFTDDFTLAQYAGFIRILLDDHKKAVLWHCSGGKDRAGIASVIVEEILGIPRESIIADYLKTNEYMQADLMGIIASVKKAAGVEGDLADQSLRNLFFADRAYIESFYDAVNQKFGSIEAFLREGIKVTEEESEKIRRKYLIHGK